MGTIITNSRRLQQELTRNGWLEFCKRYGVDSDNPVDTKEGFKVRVSEMDFLKSISENPKLKIKDNWPGEPKVLVLKKDIDALEQARVSLCEYADTLGLSEKTFILAHTEAMWKINSRIV